MTKNALCEAPAVWGIIYKPKNVFVSFGAKCGWNGSGPAIRAFQVHNEYKKFQDFPDFAVVNLSKLYYEAQKKDEEIAELKRELEVLRYQTGWKTGSNGR